MIVDFRIGDLVKPSSSSPKLNTILGIGGCVGVICKLYDEQTIEGFDFKIKLIKVCWIGKNKKFVNMFSNELEKI